MPAAIPTEYDPATVHRMLSDGKARLVDVREPDEYRREHIDGALLVPSSTFDPAQVPNSNGAITILHCKAGGRSLKAGQRLLESGRPQAAHMKGGIDAWKAAGLPVIADRGAPMPVLQQTQIVMGSIVLLSALAGAFWTPWALGLTCFIGGGLIVAGLTGTCGMASVIAKAPWNRRNSCCEGDAGH